MPTKICTKCGIEKDIDLFHKCKHNKDGYQLYCIKCRSIKSPEKIKKEEDDESLYKQELKRCTRCCEIKPLSSYGHSKRGKHSYTPTCKTCVVEVSKTYNKTERYRNYQQRYQLQYYKTHRKERKDNVAKSTKSAKGQARLKEYWNSIEYKIAHALRQRLYYAIKTSKSVKSNKTTELLGCSVAVFKDLLESLFKSGMSWDNYGNKEGQWSIDHIIPCASFDLTDPEQQKQCFYHTNLQPMWHKDNLSKSSFHDGKKHFVKRN